MPQGVFNSAQTAWHITVGCYMSRLHGGDLPTVDRQHNQRGQPFIGHDPERESRERDRAAGEPVRLTQHFPLSGNDATSAKIAVVRLSS